MYGGLLGLGLRDQLTIAVRIQHGYIVVEGIIPVFRIEYDEVGSVAFLDAVGIAQMQGTGRIGGNELVGVADLIVAQHMAGIQTHEDGVTHISVAQGVPRIKDIIVTKDTLMPSAVSSLTRVMLRRLG